MKELVIAICAILILLAIFIIVRTIIRSFKGKCCEECKGCSMKSQCDVAQKEKDKD